MQNYEEFVEKFKNSNHKKTTDDCYTPQNVYNAVASWVTNEYKINRDTFCRPFYPGGDYENYDYKNKVVVDNPPFSILSKIVDFYNKNGIKYFLFAPTLTFFGSVRNKDCTAIPIGVTVTYQNGARVNTSFVTNLEKGIQVRTAPVLYEMIDEANKINISKSTSLPKYEYPYDVIRSGHLYQLSKMVSTLKYLRGAANLSIN